MTQLAEQVARRRTFAIISHPDAGKTTLTEKLLLYGGMLETAGAVRGRKNQKSATSDGVLEGRDRATDKLKWTATVVDLVFGSNSQLRALAEVPILLDQLDAELRNRD